VAKGIQDADDGGIGGQDSEANGCDHGEKYKDGHKERNHDRPTFICYLCILPKLASVVPILRSSSAEVIVVDFVFNLTALTLPAIDD